MTQKLDEATIKKLLDMAAGHVLTEDEAKVLNILVRGHQGFIALGWIGTSIRNILIVVGSILAAYGAVTGALAEWIKKMAGVE